MNVHSSIIYKSQQVGIMQVSINRLMDNQNEIYTYNKYYSAIKRNEVDICYHMDEPGKHYAKWKKPVIKDHILYDSTYMKYLEEANP